MWHVPLLDLHGSWVMGHMGTRPHEQWGTWAMGHMGDGAHCHNNVIMGHIVDVFSEFSEYIH